MSKLEEAMLKRMTKIVCQERRPFSYLDFRIFEMDGKQYSPIHGTIRNYFSNFTKAKKIEFCYRDTISFYTLPGHRFVKGKMMTDNHTDNNYTITNPIYKTIQNIPFGKRCIHDIHLTFTTKGLWQLLSEREWFKNKIHPKNNSIPFSYFEIEKKNLTVKITIQKTDTVNVVVVCSQHPIPLDTNGIIRLSEALTRTEERLASILNDSRNSTHNVEFNPNPIKIQNKDEWIITLWHIGRDSIDEYSGDKFHCSWKVAKNLLIRVYSKEMKFAYNKSKKGKLTNTIIRTEVQENPHLFTKRLCYFIKNSSDIYISALENKNFVPL